MQQNILKKDYYIFSHLPSPKVIFAFSSRHLGNMSLSYGDTADSLNHRKVLLEKLDIDYRDLVCAQQVHGSRIKLVRYEDKGRGALSYNDAVASTDAFVTSQKNMPLAIFTADCLSVFLYDPKSPAIGLVHAGWRSSKEEISARVIKLMQKEFGSQPRNIYISFGPTMRSCCYEVKQEFEKFFPGSIIKKNNLYYLDLIAVNRKQLLDSGINEANISDCGICTYCSNQDYFSYRREGEFSGRILSVAMLSEG